MRRALGSAINFVRYGYVNTVTSHVNTNLCYSSMVETTQVPIYSRFAFVHLGSCSTPSPSFAAVRKHKTYKYMPQISRRRLYVTLMYHAHVVTNVPDT